MKEASYKAQVELLLRILPSVAKEECFALKGGTAINLFVWDMPRLSVDIDLTYVLFDDRKKALNNIADALRRIQERIEKEIPGSRAELKRIGNDPEAKLLCSLQREQVKIEVNTIMRGTIQPTRILPLSDKAQETFEQFVQVPVLSNAELFGGKLCAALDRQHPRDLFDIKQLFENDGLTEDIKNGFIAALLSHNRPINELLQPNELDQKDVFDSQFKGMATQPFTYQNFEEVRRQLVEKVSHSLSDQDKKLLISFKSGEPDWSLSSIEKLKELPAVRWKLQNIKKFKTLKPEEYGVMVKKLEKALNSR